jgi:spermidine/putrescine transport system substrate-binding protein
MSKKKAFIAAGVAVVAIILTLALAPSRPEAPAEGAAAPEGAAGQAQTGPRPLNIFIWSEYIDPDVVADFEKTHNVKVRLDLYESNEEMMSLLQTGRQGAYDIIVPTTYFVPSLIKLGLIQPLDHSLLPNLANLAPRFTRIEEDPGNKYTIPYQWGTSGLVVRAGDPASVDPSWDLLFKESPSQGTFVLFDTARDVLGSALIYLGYSPNTTDPDQIREAGELLIKVKNRPNFMGYSGGVDGLAKVVSGVASVAQVYSGEAVKAAMEEPGIVYVTPKEGCEIWVDLFAIPKGADHAATAHEFLNYVLQPQVAAKLSEYAMYATPNAKGVELVDESLRGNPAIYPSEELLDKMEYYKDLGDASRLYEETWTIVKSR